MPSAVLLLKKGREIRFHVQRKAKEPVIEMKYNS